jgi:hypothetical protein
VDYISELHPPRIDLHELRWELNLKENGYNEWKFTGNNSLVSRLKLKSPGGSSLEKNYFISMVVDYLKSGGRIETTSQ